ncbi:hypothetical protein LCGC14_2656320, partial [marine sediment metagenome]
QEGPSRHLSSLWLAKPCPVTNPLQIFEGDPFTGVFSLRDELFADGVVYIFAESLLFAAYLFELTPDLLGALTLTFRFSSGFLEGLTVGMVFLPDVLNGVTAVALTHDLGYAIHFDEWSLCIAMDESRNLYHIAIRRGDSRDIDTFHVDRQDKGYDTVASIYACATAVIRPEVPDITTKIINTLTNL